MTVESSSEDLNGYRDTHMNHVLRERHTKPHSTNVITYKNVGEYRETQPIPRIAREYGNIHAAAKMCGGRENGADQASPGAAQAT